MGVRNWVLGVLRRQPVTIEAKSRTRGPATHVIILDGTLSTLDPGQETNAGITFKLLREVGLHANMTVYYEAGIQWRDWTETFGVIAGRGINRQIERAYGVICSRWRPGDRIFLIGYSRGAFAVRSLAGVISRIGLVRSQQATSRNIRLAYRYYARGTQTAFSRRFIELYCDQSAEVASIGVWDTVKSLGLRLPILWRLEEERHGFHSGGLEPCVHSAYHALALDERRDAFRPEVWKTPDLWAGHLEQMWFRGTHSDVGGQIGDFAAARPLSNIPLVWLLEKLESEGLQLPDGWQSRFERDAAAPSLGLWRGWGKLFVARHRRRAGQDPSEHLHPSVGHRKKKRPASVEAGLMLE